MTKRISFSKPRRANQVLLAVGLMLVFMIWMFPGLALAHGPEGHQPNPVKVVQSQKSFPETLNAFKKEVRKAGWGIVNINNMAGMLSKRGFTLHPVVILDVCSGKYSAQILSKDDYRPISAFMPCRVSIYQTSEGKVFMARMNIGAFTNMMPPEVAKVMSASDEEITEIIDKTVQ